jgi:outer membrane protein OmpA-like peptidoglycan-associated protein
MKKCGLLLLALAVAGVAAAQDAGGQQTPPATPPPSMQQSTQEQLPPPPAQVTVKSTNLVEKVQAPTLSDRYCSGFITDQKIGNGSVVRAGFDTPYQTRFAEPGYVYVQGSGFQEGASYLIVRKLRDPNRWEAYPGQNHDIREAGDRYADVGSVEVIKGGIRGNQIIMSVQRTCEPIVPGDYVIPSEERPQLALMNSSGEFDPFPMPSGKLQGRIIAARDFDQFLSTGRIAYLNVGSDKGVKPGDYFRVVRTYDAYAKDPVDALSFKATTSEDTQANNVVFPRNELSSLPRISVAQMIILNVHPKSSSGLITVSIEGVKVGDKVEMMEPPPPPPTPPTPPSLQPTISCVATPDTVHKGESSTITCQADSPDNHPISIGFTTSAGAVTPHDNSAVLDTAQVAAPSTVTVTGTVTDDRNLTASAPATVNVQEAPPAPQATSQTINFKPRSAYVDNKAKAVLDQVALQLQQQADATCVIIGHSDKGEAKTLAMRRAENVRTYLTNSKGIDPKRIDTRTSDAAGKIAEVWVVPAGATVPSAAPAPQQ